MQISFKVASAQYDFDNDFLAATVTRTDDQRAEEEAFVIKCSFATRHYQIALSDAFQETNNLYPAEILYAFMKAFDKAYMSLSHEASPIDALNDLSFAFEAE
jgi:hypothetical protein